MMCDPTLTPVQGAVAGMARLGPMPSAVSPALNIVGDWESALRALVLPISEADAGVLAGLFGDDDCYGLAWTLIHVIETTPGWPLWELLPTGGGKWIELRRARAGA